MPTASRAAVLYVNQHAPGPAHDGASWATAFTTIQAGLAAAHSGDEVWVAAATYTENVTLSVGAALYGGFKGTEATRNQRNWKANITVLDGNQQGNVVTVPEGAPRSTVLDGFTVQHGNGILVYSGTIPFRYGGGLYAIDASPTIAHNLFRDNSVSTGSIGSYGGGGYFKGGYPLITHNTFTGNTGAAVFGEVSTVDIRDNAVTGNGDGFIFAACALTVVNNTVAKNGRIGIGLMQRPCTGIVGNNIVWGNGNTGIGFYPRPDLAFWRNCVHGNQGPDYDSSYAPSPAGTNGNISVDPRLAKDSLHLRPDSPCVETGDDSLAQIGDTDIDGQLRVIGQHVDIGADEFDFTSTVPPPPPVVHVRPDGNDDNDGATWATAKRTVRAAVFDLAVAGGEAWVAAGIYPGGIEVVDKVALYGGFAGTETHREQRAPATHETVLDGLQAMPVITVSAGSTQTTVIDGFTLRNGSGTVKTKRTGGGVYSVGASPVIRNNRITANYYALGSGAGIYCEGGSPVIDSNTISGNSGGVNVAISCRRTTATLTRNTIVSNTAYFNAFGSRAPFSIFGGAVGLIDSTVTLTGNIIAGNSFTFTNGEYLNGGGGGLYCENSVVFAANNTISGNTVRIEASDGGVAMGGGVLASGSTVLLVNNLINANTLYSTGFYVAGRGAGVYQDGGTMVLANNTMAGNTMSGHGVNTTIQEGGGLFVSSASDPATSCSAANNIIAFNTGGVNWGGSPPAWSHNDVYGNGQDYPASGDPTHTNGNIKADPLFANRTAGDYRLRPPSPCIDAGDDSAIRGSSDLDGQPRLQGRHVDIGAFEFPVSLGYTIPDAARALRIAGGLDVSGPADIFRLDIADPAAQRLDLADAVRLARKAMGLDAHG